MHLLRPTPRLRRCQRRRQTRRSQRPPHRRQRASAPHRLTRSLRHSSIPARWGVRLQRQASSGRHTNASNAAPCCGAATPTSPIFCMVMEHGRLLTRHGTVEKRPGVATRRPAFTVRNAASAMCGACATMSLRGWAGPRCPRRASARRFSPLSWALHWRAPPWQAAHRKISTIMSSTPTGVRCSSLLRTTGAGAVRRPCGRLAVQRRQAQHRARQRLR